MTLTKAHLIGQVKAANPNFSQTRACETLEGVLLILKNSLETGKANRYRSWQKAP